MLVTVDTGETSVLLPVKEPKKMIQVSVTPDGRPHVKINSSSISIIQECLRKAQYSLHERWISENESPATLFGSAVHKALEVYYSGSPDEREMPTWEACESIAYGHAPKQHNLILNAISAFVEKAQPLSPLPETDKRSIQNGTWILFHYFKQYLNDPYQAYIDEQGAFVERKFEMRFHEDDELVIDVFGTIDCVLQHTKDRNLVVADHKTTSALNFGGQSYYDRDRPNHQYTLYAMGAQKVFGIKTEEFMVNVISVKPKPKTLRGSAPDFPRQITRRTEEDFEELRDVILKVARDYLSGIKTGVWPLGPVSSCNLYGACNYKQVCAAPKSLRNNILTAKFCRAGS